MGTVRRDGVTTLRTKGGDKLPSWRSIRILRNGVFNANNFFLKAAGHTTALDPKTSLEPKPAAPCACLITTDAIAHSGSSNLEGFRLRTGEPFTATVPTAAERNGDFTGINTPIMDPCAGSVNVEGACPESSATPTAFSGNVIPGNRISPTSKALLNLWPTANASGLTTASGRSTTSYGCEDWRQSESIRGEN